MNSEHYDFRSGTSILDFEFESVGPKGRITKVVRYDPTNLAGKTFFSLVFGQRNHVADEIDYMVRSDNGDRGKILSTVAATVMEFTLAFPDMFVFAQGSTPSRTRLYQMKIAANLSEIQSLFEVYGYHNESWEDFERDVNYSAFMVKRK